MRRRRQNDSRETVRDRNHDDLEGSIARVSRATLLRSAAIGVVSVAAGGLAVGLESDSAEASGAKDPTTFISRNQMPAVIAANETNGIAIEATSEEGPGVYSLAGSPHGLMGTAIGTAGVYGGGAPHNAGVIGESVYSWGVYGQTSAGSAVAGMSADGYGGSFAGGAGPIHLEPGASEPPAAGKRGNLYVTSSGKLWFCTAGTKDGRATWKKVVLE